MAEFSETQGAFLQYQMRLKLKTQLLNLATMTGREIRNLLFELRQVSDNAEYARLVRQFLPIIVERAGERSGLITAKYYQEARGLNALTAGTAIAIGSSFIPRADSFKRDSDSVARIMDKKMSSLAYNFNKLWSPELVYELNPVINENMMTEDNIKNIITPDQILSSRMNQEKKDLLISQMESNSNITGFVTGKREIESRIDLEAPIIELVERAPLDYSYVEMEQIMKDDPNAGDSVKRTTTAGSCVFCKHMATFVGSEGWAKDKFHNGCGCTPGASFAYEADYQPKWSGDYEEEYYRVQDELIEEAKNFEKRKISTKRWSESQGKEVRAMKTVWIDRRTGKEGVPPKTGSRAVIAKISENERKK